MAPKGTSGRAKGVFIAGNRDIFHGNAPKREKGKGDGNNRERRTARGTRVKARGVLTAGKGDISRGNAPKREKGKATFRHKEKADGKADGTHKLKCCAA